MRLLIVSFVLVLSACVKPPNIPVCRDLLEKKVVIEDMFGISDIVFSANPICEKEINENRCGYCTYTISGQSFYIGEREKNHFKGRPWSEIRQSSVLLPADSYAEIKSFIVNLCKKNKDCEGDIDKWRTRLEALEKK